MSFQTTGIVQEIGETKTYPKKEGEGVVEITKLKIAGKYFTSFRKDQLEGIFVGSQVDVTYTEKENEFKGKNYTNRNISVITLHQDIQLSPTTQAKIDAVEKVMKETGTNATDINFANKVKLKGENVINIGDKTYKITLEEI